MRQVGHRRTGTGSQLRGWRAEDGRGSVYSKSGITLALAVSFIHSFHGSRVSGPGLGTGDSKIKGHHSCRERGRWENSVTLPHPANDQSCDLGQVPSPL